MSTDYSPRPGVKDLPPEVIAELSSSGQALAQRAQAAETPAEVITELTQGTPPAPTPPTLIGVNATLSLSGEVAIVAACGTVVLFEAERAKRLLAFFAGRAA